MPTTSGEVPIRMTDDELLPYAVAWSRRLIMEALLPEEQEPNRPTLTDILAFGEAIEKAFASALIRAYHCGDTRQFVEASKDTNDVPW